MNESNASSHVETDTWTTLALWIYSIFPVIFLVVGIPGNLISLIIWLRRISSTPGSTSLFLSAMSVTNTYVILHGCARHWLLGLTNERIDLRVLLGCRGPVFVFTVISDLSSWLIILLCVERAICTWKPIQFKQICRLKYGGIALILVIFSLTAFNMHFFWTVETVESRCETVKRFRIFHIYWTYADFAVYSFLPLIVILVVNSSIILRLRHTQKCVKRDNSSKTTTISMPSENREPLQRTTRKTDGSARILRTVFCMATCHFALTMPVVIFFLCEDTFCVDASGQFIPQCNVLEKLTISLQIANHVTHFFIYSFTSSIFLSDLKKLIPCVAWLFRETN
ncbi:uncharacterized protein DEA37_0005246 [Paragonimus westermani]|uniref:G-protein coupled receptors family 1 profile domain-containing protein n=1 Tax=Paragonimus westermani TaxID=34504 RepID=A0A5J4NID3_9TREM|nr:uncharacterized protein DEA37_0005246 [Paragonimus westermani]